MLLHEYKINDLLVSDITKNATHKFGVGQVSFHDVRLNYPNNILISYEVLSSSEKGPSHFSHNGQLLAGKSNGYEVELNFINIANIMPQNFTSLPYSQQQQILRDVFKKADVEVSCDCGAWYWQGMEQDGDKSGLSYYSFTGHPGKDIWKNRHAGAGGDHGKGICKHINEAIQHLDAVIPNILKKIGSGTSTAQSTVQADNLEAPEQPAGTPVEAKSEVKQGSIKSLKAEPTVEQDIDEINSTSDQLDLPKMNTSEVKSKEVEAETEAAEGPEDAEPPIEEPTLAKDKTNEEESEEILNKEPLDKEKSGTLEESFNRIYEKSLIGWRGTSAGENHKNFWEPGWSGTRRNVGKWYSSSKEVAKQYADAALNGRVVSNKLEFNNPMFFDAQGEEWDSLEDEDGNETDTDKLSIEAFSKGKDGLIIKDVIDCIGREEITADTIVALKPEVIKEQFKRIYEKVLKDNAKFYDLVYNELHDVDNVQIFSSEPDIRDNFSCFDYSKEGCDRKEDDHDDRFRWDKCKLTMDDDGLYWKSKSGKNAALTIYSIVKAELKSNEVRIWVAPIDSSDQMAVVSFFTNKSKDPIFESIYRNCK